MEELEVTWFRVIKVWWSLTWRIVIYGMIFGIVVSLPLGLATTALGLDEALANHVTRNIPTLAALLLGIWVTRVVLRKTYSDFRIVLVPSDEALLEKVAEQPDSSVSR